MRSLTLNLRPSAILAVVVFLAHAFALAALWAIPGYPGLTIPFALLVVGSLMASLYRQMGQRHPKGVVGVRFSSAGTLTITRRDGRVEAAILVPGSRVFALGVVLAFRAEGQRAEYLPILRDAVSPERHRWLRQQLLAEH